MEDLQLSYNHNDHYHTHCFSEKVIDDLKHGKCANFNLADGTTLTIKFEQKSVSYVLHNEADVDDIVLFYEDGWQIGCTIIDNEDLFTRSLDNKLLQKTVKSFNYETRDWFNKPVMVVNI